VKKPHGHGGGKGRGPAEDNDHEIWRHAAATVEPLKRGKSRVHSASEIAKAAPSKPKLRAESEKMPAKSRSGAPLPEISLPKVVPAKTPELATFDRNSVRKIRGGRVDIEARVDLHGMRQDEAHVALRRFLLSCQSRGLRFVLVITGKGKPIGTPTTQFGDNDRERGVLKRNVPRWLDEPDLRAIVVSFTTAAIQHGGEGAIYIHLRSKNRA
jgi:DNA-nicking Smr family endonuclease